MYFFTILSSLSLFYFTFYYFFFAKTGKKNKMDISSLVNEPIDFRIVVW